MPLYRLRHSILVGLRSLMAHRLRSVLTALGIVLGVASVIVMLAVGEAARRQALKQLEDLGINSILIRSVKPTDTDRQAGQDAAAYGLTFADLDRIRDTIPTVVSGIPLREFHRTIRHGRFKLEGRLAGVTPAFFEQTHVELSAGRILDDLDEKSFANVAVIGAEAAEKLFPGGDPIGRSVSMDAMDHPISFLVVGVLEPSHSSGTENGDADFDKTIFIPFAVDRARVGQMLITYRRGVGFQRERLELSRVKVEVDSPQNVEKTANVIQSLLDQYHPRKDFSIVVPIELLRKAEATQRMFSLILGAIAGISLIVGGIGIANIMLATVTERTREIGIRRALGAKRRDIAAQFLIETLVLTCLGGLLGIGIGIGMAHLVSEVFGQPAIVRLWSPILAFTVSVFVGLLAGYFPARRAARLDPIEALRHE